MSLVSSLTPSVDINTGVLLPSERKQAMLDELKSLDEAWKKKTAIDIPEAVTYEKLQEKNSKKSIAIIVNQSHNSHTFIGV